MSGSRDEFPQKAEKNRKLLGTTLQTRLKQISVLDIWLTNEEQQKKFLR